MIASRINSAYNSQIFNGVFFVCHYEIYFIFHRDSSGLFHVHFLLSFFLYLLLPMYSFLLAANSTNLSPRSLRSPMPDGPIILFSPCFLMLILALKSHITMVYCVVSLSISSFISSCIHTFNFIAVC